VHRSLSAQRSEVRFVMAFLLVIMRGRSNASAHKVPPGASVIGRQEGCQLQVRSSQVSRRHCELIDKDDTLTVKDLGSSNGTFVNGEKVEGSRTLQPGDTLTIGNVTFRIERADGAGAARKPGDTAVPEEAPVAAPSDAEVIPLEDDEATVHIPPPSAKTPPPPPKAVPAVARKAAPVAASVSETGTADVEPVEVEASGAPELGEDAVAEFLLNIELDDEDKV
jgi:pSer/pThr/pTyr-binding forkhead associated (FHA) protein